MTEDALLVSVVAGPSVGKGRTLMDTIEKILARDYSFEFDKLRQNRMVMSHYKYGWVSETYGERLADAIKSLEKRLELYKETGNTEFLLDVANFAMIERMYPQHINAHFRATDSDESPGLVGISSKELMEKEY